MSNDIRKFINIAETLFVRGGVPNISGHQLSAEQKVSLAKYKEFQLEYKQATTPKEKIDTILKYEYPLELTVIYLDPTVRTSMPKYGKVRQYDLETGNLTFSLINGSSRTVKEYTVNIDDCTLESVDKDPTSRSWQMHFKLNGRVPEPTIVDRSEQANDINRRIVQTRSKTVARKKNMANLGKETHDNWLFKVPPKK